MPQKINTHFRKPVKAASSYLQLHHPVPDYSRPKLKISKQSEKAIIGKLTELYGSEEAETWFPEIERRMRVYYAHKTPEMIQNDANFVPSERFTEKDIILITYGDLFVSPGKKPLQVLSDILTRRVAFATTIHILPFFPYSSDRGFSVKSYYTVDPNMGVWEDIEKLSTRFELMFDGVINHVSSKSRMFQEFLNGNPDYDDFFIRFSTQSEISTEQLAMILRPRTNDVLTEFDTISGSKMVWTTFSEDQIDLNYRNIKVLIYVIDVLLYYVKRGADIIRLDAVTYLWAEIGTSCAHLEQTHKVIQLFRSILDVVAPQVALVTETNVPHNDNIKYFGDGCNEAQMIYNFTLPPLTLFTFYTGNCRKLSQWAEDLEPPTDTATFFNFLDSHDGIGLLPVRDILTEEESRLMIKKVEEHGGMISYRADREGNEKPYEMNITWFSALNNENSDESLDLQIDRFVASRAVSLVIRGIPGIYIPSLIGSTNDIEQVLKTGDARSINRKKFDAEKFLAMLDDRNSCAARVMRKLGVLFGVRIHSPAFHPNGGQRIISENDNIFAVVRHSPHHSEEIICLINVTDQEQEFLLRKDHLDYWPESIENMLTRKAKGITGDLVKIRLRPYKVKFLTGK